jgi:hypothetical protein
MDDSDAYRL